MKYMLSYAEEVLTENHIPDTAEFNLVLLTNNSLMGNLPDYTTFLYPNAQAYTAEAGGYPEEINQSLPTLVFSELPMFPAEIEGSVLSREFENIRYGSTITWYCLIPCFKEP